ncbi:TPA: hypothetical protein I7730_14675 [Vibrio vulnificus]|uniref:Uncharacterized protein n=1 Tax=Vibrio vulnificus TaxID=672 RepID=A0A8H9N1E8_VIBVL|nr:hypothetical protein [Vibrio vulnificus]HAS8541021.1 hypothetical protein [Vibrio vulnificus]
MFRSSLVAVVAASIFSSAAIASSDVSKIATKSLDGLFESHQQSEFEAVEQIESPKTVMLGDLLQRGDYEALKQHIDIENVYKGFLEDSAAVVGQIDALDSLLGGSASSTLDVKYHTGQALVAMLSFQFKAQVELYKDDPDNFVRLLSSRVKVYPITGCSYLSGDAIEMSCPGEQHSDVWHTKSVNGKTVVYRVELSAIKDAAGLIDGILKKTN